MAAPLEDVRHRILIAARGEFAQFGLAGARVDRIARDAHASKERLYAHFTDKVALFEAVLDLNRSEFFGSVVLDPDHPADFVGELFDHALASPEHIRMLTWARLEGRDSTFNSDNATIQRHLSALRAAQDRGIVDAVWQPEQLLTLLFATGLAWAQSPKPAMRNAEPEQAAEQRVAAVEAARRLLAVRA